jgi:hypothetical protein
MLAFRNALTDCDLDDMGFSGDPLLGREEEFEREA